MKLKTATRAGVSPDNLRWRLEKARIDLACLEDWGKGIPIAKAERK